MSSKQPVTTEQRDDGSSVLWWNPLNWPAGIWLLLIALGLMTTPFVIRAFMLAGIPDMPEPFDEVAYSTWNVPVADDAFTYYREALALHNKRLADLGTQGLIDFREPEDSMLILEKGWQEANESTRKWVELNRESMTIWRRGTEKDGGICVSPSKLSVITILDVIQQQRMFARLAVLEESRLIANGDLDQARKWARAVFRSGGHASRRGCIIQALVGIAIHAISSEGIKHWAEHPDVSSEQLRRALIEARIDDKLYETLSNNLISEYLMMRNSLRTSDWNAHFAPINPTGDTNGVPDKIMKILYWTIGEPEACSRILKQSLANQLPEIDKPIAQRHKLTGAGVTMLFDRDPTIPLRQGQLDPAGVDRAINRSSLTRAVLPSIGLIDAGFLRRQARQATLEALLAIQAYRRDQGRFPADLSELVPQYLDVIPSDPYSATGGSLLYRRDKDTKAFVWSVGDDRVDSGGVIEVPNSKAPDLGFELK